MIEDCNPCLMLALEHLYNRHGEGIINALGRSMQKGVSSFLDTSQVFHVNHSCRSCDNHFCRSDICSM